MLNRRYQQVWTGHQADELERLKQLTGLPKTEIIRRMFDHCVQESVLNQLVPTLSGSLGLRGAR